MLSLMLTTFLSTISISSLEFAASIWRAPFLTMEGGHILLYPLPDDTSRNPLTFPSRVFDGEKARKIVTDIFPEASTTSQLIVPATYIGKTGATHSLSHMSCVVGRSDNLDSWYLMPETRSGLPLASVPAKESTIVCKTPYPVDLPDAAIRVAKYVEGDHPWQLAEAEARTVSVAGTLGGVSGDYPAYMRIEALRSITGCPDNMTSLLGIAFPGIQYKVDRGRLEQLRTRLAQEMPGIGAITPEEIAESMVASVGLLRDTPRKYLPIIYAISFMVVAAIVASIAYSRRRELRMLHVIGSSRMQVRFLFATECVIASALAGLIGFLPLWLLGRFVLGATQVSLLPLLITLSGASLIAVLRSVFLLNGNPSEEGEIGPIRRFTGLMSGIHLGNPLRTLFLLLTIVGTLFAFMGTEAATRDLSMSAANVWSTSLYDLSITGPSAFSISKQVTEMVGVRSAEDVYVMPAIVNGGAGEVLVAGDGRIVDPRYASGRKPQTEYEIAVGRFIAERDLLEIDSEITLSRTDGYAEAVVYKVCGIVSDPAYLSVITKEGLARLEPSPEQYQTVLVARDASIDAANTREQIEQIVEGTGMKVRDYRADQVMVNSRVYAITSVTSGLVLLCGMGSFLVLLGLHQRDRSYGLGVLRALGYSKKSIFSVLFADSSLLIGAGLLIGSLGSVAAVYALHLGNVSTLIARNGGPTVTVAIASLSLAAFVSHRTSNSSVTQLLRADR